MGANHSKESSTVVNDSAIQKDRQLLIGARQKGSLSTLKAYVRLSGPGWLQSAITLGGGSLAGSLYLGVLGGLSLLWLQPMAMIMGIIMLSAISYVTLSTGQRPFHAINQHVNPVLGWGWAIATLMANLVWALPQFSLATAAVRQNLLPSLVGPEALSDIAGKLIVGLAILIICVSVVWFYDKGSKGIKIFETLLKIMVAVIVLSFFGVVLKMSLAQSSDGQPILYWGKILAGLIPDFSLLSSPAVTFDPYINAVASEFQDFWRAKIVAQQRDVMITATATAVGINMTFLLPYSMLKRRWDKNFRGLAIFDLSTGMFIPFILATGCVVIASASQFHTQPAPGLLGETDQNGYMVAPAKSVLDNAVARIKFEIESESLSQLQAAEQINQFDALSNEGKLIRIMDLPRPDRRMAAMLVQRDAFSLANSLAPLTGQKFSQYVFGIGVVGMAVSSIIILMLINGFVVCEILGTESKGWTYRLGFLAPCIGIIGPFIWTGGKAQFWLAVPTSVFGMMLLPIAYFTFYLLMNQKSLLGEHLPTGLKRWFWNTLMALAAALAAFGSIWSVWSKTKWIGIGAVTAFILLALVVQFMRRKKTP
ncbi:MAG: divalent metal cation transporter [Planctomycetes bacterium]|nr:divalent metal cation transporter [Planctomycetota bacterium]